MSSKIGGKGEVGRPTKIGRRWEVVLKHKWEVGGCPQK